MTVWLLTWLWQGMALTLVAALLLKPQRTNAATRHLVWWVALAAVIWLGSISSPYWGLTPVPVPGSDPNGMESAAEPWLRIQEAPFLLSIFLGVWAAIALVKLLRLLPGIHAVYAMRDRCRPFPRDVELQLPLWLETQGRGRRAELVICDAVPGATVLGFQRPCIALPSSLVAALDVDEIDQIVLHEYAHVRRRDDWTRLAQALLQAALWIHPAVAFIGRALNREREMACDEWVVGRTGLPKAYARCLTRAAEVCGRTRVEPALVPTLFGGQRELVRRVNRLLAVKGQTRRKVSFMTATAAGCAIVVMSAQLNAVPLLGESVGMALPEVAAPIARVSPEAIVLPEPAGSLLPFTVARASLPAAALRASAARTDEPGEPTNPRTDEPHEPAFALRASASALRAPADKSAQQAPGAIESLTARSFEGAYRSQDATRMASNSTNAWSAAATPGLAVAEAARKTGVGLAGAVSRASMALARRF